MKLTPNIDSLGISRIKFLIGIILGGLLAFSLYSFAYVMREALRVLSVTYDYDMWVLSESEVSFYNLVYAFIAVIFGQSVCFIYWLDRPKRQFGKFSRKVRTIVNDQRVLNWFFLFWFFKMAFIYGIMFGATFSGGYFLMSFYPDYNYLFVLIIIVLFLNTWTTIRLVFKRKSFKWMLISMLVVSAVSFGMSKIDIVDYKALNENFLSRNIHYKYTMQLPESKIYKRPQRLSLIEKIYVVYAHNDTINPKIVIPGNVEIKFEDLPMYIQNWQSIRDEREVNKIDYIIYIHKDVKMDFINKLKQQFANSGVLRISYAVLPQERKFDDRYYEFYSFPVRTSYHAPWEDGQGFYNGLDTFDIKFNVKSNGGEIEVNGNPVGIENLKETFMDSLKSNSSCIVKFYFRDLDSFELYFSLLSKFWAGAYELREDYSQSFYGKTFDELEKDESRIVKKKYPIRVFDMTEERVRKFEPKDNN